MKIYDGVLFVGSGDSPDDRDMLWMPGHVDKALFASHALCAEAEVKHIWADSDNTADGEDDPAWWNEAKTEDCPFPITIVWS